jgi:hypothetical protein
MFALFKNKKFIGYSPDFPSSNDLGINVQEVPEEYSDVSKYTWVGDIDNGKFTDINTALRIKKQIEIEDSIKEKFSTQQQLLNIMNQLYLISTRNNLYDIDFKEMVNEIKEICNK